LGIKPLTIYLKGSTPLAALHQQLSQLKAWNQVWKICVPTPLNQFTEVIDGCADHWIIGTPKGVIAGQLKQIKPKILETLAQKNIFLKELTFKVIIPKTSPPTPRAWSANPLSQNTLQQLAQSYYDLPDHSPIKESLRKLLTKQGYPITSHGGSVLIS
jgi:hypothetical protein